MDLTNPQIIIRNKEIAQLRAENARLKEELALSRDLRRSQAQVNGNLSEQLAKERERAKTRELALDAAVSSSCVLGAELAKERNNLEMAEAIIASFDVLITGLTNDLAAAQATIAEMREALTKIELGTEDAIPPYRCISKEHMSRIAHKALALPANLDALHEALAKECERLAKTHGVGVMKWLCEEAATHRARKEGK